MVHLFPSVDCRIGEWYVVPCAQPGHMEFQSRLYDPGVLGQTPGG